MADHPILFSAPMVRALLAGRKTQTRRLLTSARTCAAPESPSFTLKGDDLTRALQNASSFRRIDGNMFAWEADAFEYQLSDRTRWLARIGYSSGDRLWVREAWRSARAYDDLSPAKMGGEEPVKYEADGTIDLRAGRMDGPWGRYRHGRFMPRWASRMTLIITDVRVQRLQDISEEDAVAEGCFKGKASGRVFENAAAMHLGGNEWRCARDWYADLWDVINGAGTWDLNPWVVAYSFSIHHRNIDQMEAAHG